jgi:hypothetical protein
VSAGNIVFGAYTFPNSFIVTDDQIVYDSDNVSIPRSVGSNDPVPKVKERTITIEGSYSSGLYLPNSTMLATAADVQSEVDKLFLALNNTTVSGAAALVMPNTLDRFILARPDKPSKTFSQGNGYRLADLKLPFYAGDPRVWSLAQHSQAMGPFTDASAHAVNLTNAGNYRTYPLVVITAGSGATVGLSGITVAVAPPGGGSVGIVLSTGLVLENGAVLAINCERIQSAIAGGFNQGGYPRRSGTNELQFATFANSTSSGSFPGNNETFPYLDPGVTSFSVQAGGNPGGGINYSVTVYWFDTWIS